MSTSTCLRAILLTLFLTIALAGGATAGQNVPDLDRGENGAPTANSANLFVAVTPSSCEEFDQTLGAGSDIHLTCAID